MARTSIEVFGRPKCSYADAGSVGKAELEFHEYDLWTTGVQPVSRESDDGPVSTDEWRVY